jgi:aldehyde dehydrogenase (NAD+)
MVTFTGSSAVGRHISALAGQSLKRVLLELGGKSANIVLDDADLEDVVTKNVFRMCRGGGQGCTNLTRMLLPRDQYEQGVEIARKIAGQIPYGDPQDPRTHMGPLISAEHRARVESYVAKGLSEGGRLVFGGGRPSHLRHGYFVEPTVIADVHPKSTIAQEEIFGPVLAVMPYESEDEAVAIANDSQYGLSGAVSSASLERAMHVARRVRTGTMDVNGGVWAGGDAMFGGMKQSGIGRECGPVGFSELLEYRIIGYPVSKA